VIPRTLRISHSTPILLSLSRTLRCHVVLVLDVEIRDSASAVLPATVTATP
jgi:hypothetical protein